MRTLHHKLQPSTRSKLQPSVKKALPFYQSVPWKTLMAEIIRRRGRTCEDPTHDPSTPRTGTRIYGDHIVELRDGGAPLDERNILLRCARCHGRKTSEARTARLIGSPPAKG